MCPGPCLISLQLCDPETPNEPSCELLLHRPDLGIPCNLLAGHPS